MATTPSRNGLIFSNVALLCVIVCQLVFIYYPRTGKDVNVMVVSGSCLDREHIYQSKLRQMNETIEGLKNTVDSVKSGKVPAKSALFEREIPETRSLSREIDVEIQLDIFERDVTVLIYGGDVGLSVTCVAGQINEIRRILPNVKIIVSSSAGLSLQDASNVQFISTVDSTTEGKALNAMLLVTETKYFLYLSEGAVVNEYDSSHSPSWLFSALQRIPELDFVGATFLRHNDTLKFAQMDIQCHRLKMCYWTLRLSYEYKYSVSDMMVCEETSSSFMGRTSSVAKFGKFDEFLDGFTTTDFFYRAKGKAVSGLLPEVFFHVNKICTPKPRTSSEESIIKQRFMDKYSLTRIRDSFGKVTNYPLGRAAKRSSILPKFKYKTNGGVNTPQAYENLAYLMTFIDDFFNSKNYTYMLVAGVALGGIKSRDILPWDGGDVDTAFFDSWQKVHSDLVAYVKQRGVQLKLSLGHFPDGPDWVRNIVVRTQPHTHGVFNEIYSREYLPYQGPEQFMYAFIHDRYIPLHRNVFEHMRSDKLYKIDYLKMQNHDGNLHCNVKGHHACVPEELSVGGGHWSDFHCK